MSNQQVIVQQSGGIGLLGAVFLVFLVLKLCGVIAWSWWWVTAPLWIPFVLIFAVVIIALLGFGIFYGVYSLFKLFSR